MKKLFLLFAMIITISANAQLQVGLRGGTAGVMAEYYSDDYTMTAIKLQWQKQVYTRYEKKKLAFELSIAHNAETDRFSNGMSPKPIKDQYTVHYTHVILTPAIQYCISNDWMKEHWHLKHYAGVQAVYILSKTDIDIISGSAGERYEMTERSVHTGAGFNYNFVWLATKRLNVNAVLQYNFFFEGGSAPTLMTGISYTFKKIDDK
jgi:hypothetical protein